MILCHSLSPLAQPRKLADPLVQSSREAISTIQCIHPYGPWPTMGTRRICARSSWITFTGSFPTPFHWRALSGPDSHSGLRRACLQASQGLAVPRLPCSSGLTALSQVWPCPCLCTPSPCVIRKALQIQHLTLLTSLYSRGYTTLFAQILLLSDTWDLVHKEASKSQGEVNQGERVCPSSLRARKRGLTCASLAWCF